MIFPQKEIVDAVRKMYPSGTRVELIRMEDPQSPPYGTKGTVMDVDSIATIHIRWDNGSSLGIAYGVDECRKLNTVKTICYGEEKVWDSCEDAASFFRNAMENSEGSERCRYNRIYTELLMGKEVCTDGDNIPPI